MFPVNEQVYQSMSESESEIGDDLPPYPIVVIPVTKRKLVTPKSSLADRKLKKAIRKSSKRKTSSSSEPKKLPSKRVKRAKRKKNKKDSVADEGDGELTQMHIGWSLFVKEQWKKNGKQYETEGKSVAMVAKQLSPVWHKMKQDGSHLKYHQLGFHLQKQRFERRQLKRRLIE
jgi:hypothetical protein